MSSRLLQPLLIESDDEDSDTSSDWEPISPLNWNVQTLLFCDKAGDPMKMSLKMADMDGESLSLSENYEVLRHTSLSAGATFWRFLPTQDGWERCERYEVPFALPAGRHATLALATDEGRFNVRWEEWKHRVYGPFDTYVPDRVLSFNSEVVPDEVLLRGTHRCVILCYDINRPISMDLDLRADGRLCLYDNRSKLLALPVGAGATLWRFLPSATTEGDCRWEECQYMTPFELPAGNGWLGLAIEGLRATEVEDWGRYAWEIFGDYYGIY